jgi:hypothetical protein
MKNILLICAGIIGFLALPVIYSTVKGYTTWYWRDSHAEILVDGLRVPGYLHESSKRLILTRRDTAKPHSYLLISNDRSATALDCGDWHPPSFFIIPIGDINPCTGSDILGETFVYYSAPEAPMGRVKIEGANLEFRTRDGKLVRVLR